MSTLSLTCQVTRSKTLLLHLISKSAGLTVSPQLLEMAGMADKSFHSFMNTVNPQHFLSVLWVLGPRAGCWWLGTERRALHRRGSRGVGETLRSILCTKAVAEALWPHPVLLHPPWPVHLCPLPVALSSWPGQGALCPPPPPTAISCPPVICFLWSFCPETSGSLWTIGNLGYLLPRD